MSEYFPRLYLPPYFVLIVLLYGQETKMTANIKAFVTHVLQQVSVWMRLQYTHHGTHYKSALR